MNKIRLAYFGSSDFSADFLEKILNDQSINRLITVKFVVTQPDRPVGRKQILTPTPVKVVAQKYEIAVKSQILNRKSQINPKSKIQNSKRLEFKYSDLFETCNLEFGALKDVDLALVYAYANMIPQELLALPKYGFWCLHPSLLPKYRGTSPMATALVNGDSKTGMTIIKMDDQIDHGPIIAQESLTIEKNDKRPDLEKKLTELGYIMFQELIIKLVSLRVKRVNELTNSQNSLNSLNIKSQNHNLATYTKKLKKDDGFIEFENLIPPLAGENSPEEVFNLFRGLFPWPGIWTLLRQGFGGQAIQKRLKITDMDLINGKLVIKKVQLEGKKEVDFNTFNKAYKLF